MNRAKRSLVAVCAVASLLVTGVGVSPVSAKTINGCVIKAKTECKNANLEGAKLNKAKLKGAKLQNAQLSKAKLKGANLKGANLKGADLTGANLTKANLTKANLSANLTRANLTRANLTKARLSEAGLEGANLTKANLSGANLSGADLTKANLTGANLSGADLTKANLTNTNLTNANLTGAKLTGAFLSGVNLTGADLTDTNLSNEAGPELPQILSTITLLNGSSLDDEILMGWAGLAEAQMQSRVSNVLMLVYDVGERIEPLQEIPESESVEHEKLLSQEQIDSLMAEFEAWLDADECMSQNAEYRADEIEVYRRYLERGGDASHMRALCPQTRVVGVGLTDSLRNLEPASETELFVLHELYHAFQQDLVEEGQCRTAGEAEDSTTAWMNEGGAHYFSTMLLVNGDQEKGRELIYEQARQAFSRNKSLRENEPDRKGAAALLLMMDNQMIEHESVMDGSLFHGCAREFQFGNSKPGMENIEEQWSQF